jgi:hypothetical protein
MSQLETVRFLKTALECSVYLAPTDPGLTKAELFVAGSQAGFQAGEIGDAMQSVATQYFGGNGKLLPDPDPMWPHFLLMREPDYRNIKAFDFLHTEFNARIRAEGGKNARLERNVLVERAVAANIPRRDMEIAITISIMCGQLSEKACVLSSKYGQVIDPLPGAQPQRRALPRDEVRERAYSIVKDVIERRTDGRPKHVESLDAFPDALDQLGWGQFRLWWTQTVAELRQSNPQTSPLSALVLSAALVEGALIFVVAHARKRNLNVFRSKDFDGAPRTWKIEDLIKSATTGNDSAILDESTRFRASTLVQARQRIHAGRMLSEFPGGIPDLRPEEARDAKATAEQVVRCVLDWLGRYPPI